MHSAREASLWLLAFSLCAALLFTCASPPNAPTTKLHTLYVLALAPYPHSNQTNDALNPSWDGGATLIPGARLAVAEINNRTDILPDFRLELIEADCGCDLTFKAVASFIDSIFYSGKQVVGGVGPACSDSTMVLSELAEKKAVSFLQVSVATSAALKIYPYTVRVVSSSFEYVHTFISLIKYNRWKNIALLYDISRSLFEDTYNEFKRQLQNDAILSDVKVVYESVVTNTFIPVEAIVESNARVVFAFLGPVAIQLMCVAGKNNMVYDTYQFIFHDRSLYEFNKDVNVTHSGTQYMCSSSFMLSIMRGNILAQYHLNRTEINTTDAVQDTVLVSNKTYRTFFREYLDILYEHLQEPGHFLYKATDLTYGPPYYDALWSLALALNRSVPVLNQRGTSLQYYWPAFNNTDLLDIILGQFYDPPLSFVGASGQIFYRKDTQDSATEIYVYQIQNDSMKLVGSSSNDTFSPIVQNVYITDQFESIKITIPLAGGVFIFVVEGIALFLTIMFHIVNVVYQNHEYIKPTSPTLNHLAFSGCYLFIVSSLLFVYPRTFEQNLLVQGVLCNGFVWSLVLGLAMVFSTVTAKIWRIYRIFVYFNNPGQLLSNHLLILLVMGLATLDTIILLTWTLVDPLLAVQMKAPLSAPDKKLVWYQYTCTHLLAWVGVVGVVNVTVIILLIAISIRARKVRSQYNNTKSINILVYLLIILVTVGVGIYGILTYNQDRSTVSTVLPAANTLICLSLVGTVYLFIFFLFLPPWLPYVQRLPFFQKMRTQEVRTAPVVSMSTFAKDHN